jgi:intracellular sulfur oxidation DsrE/DsrF family protein
MGDMEWLYALCAVIVLTYVYYLYNQPQKLVISAASGKPDKDNIPAGLQWAAILVRDYPGKYDITVVLHGSTIKYGLTENPQQTIMTSLNKLGVKFVICDMCLKEQLPEIQKDSQYKTATTLDFIKPVSFNADYIAERAKNKFGHSNTVILWA